MKKHIIALLIAFCYIASSLAVDAANVSNQDNKFNENLKDALIQNLDAKDKELLFDSKHFDESMQGLDFLNKPVIKCYTEHLWGEFENGLQSAVSHGENAVMEPYYIVFDTQTYKIGRWTDNGVERAVVLDTYTKLPRYLKDIQLLDSEIKTDSSKHTIENIVCFDMSHSFFGIVVYLVTDGGNIVKYYEDETSEAVVFSEEEFKLRAKKYYDFLISPENNYDENGNFVGGNNVSFAEYTKNNPNNITEDNTNNVDDPKAVPNPDEKSDVKKNGVFGCVATAVTVIIAIVTVTCVLRKKKKY